MITVLKNNKIQKGSRKKRFDGKDFDRSGVYGPMVDHKKMDDYQRSVFLKELKQKRKKERIRSGLIWGLSIVLTGLIIWGVPQLLKLL